MTLTPDDSEVLDGVIPTESTRTWSMILQTSGAKVYWLLVSVATTFITARLLGPEGRGVVAAMTGWLMMFTTFGYLSLAQVVFYLGAGKPHDQWLPPVLGTLLTLVAGITVIGWLIAAIGYRLTAGSIFHNLTVPVLLVGFVALPFTLWAENGTSILLALRSVQVVNLAQVAGGTATLIGVFLLVRYARWGVVGALIAVLAYHVFVSGVSLTHIMRKAKRMTFDRVMARELLVGGSKLHVSAIGTYLAVQSNVLIINQFRPPAETAYYQLAAQMITAIQLLPAAASMVAYSIIAKDGPDKAWPQHRKLLLQSLGVVVAIGIIGYVASPLVIVGLLGARFLPAVSVFRILLLTLIGMTLSTLMASQWIARGLFLQVGVVSVILGTLTVAGNYLVVPRYGIHGAAWDGGMAVWVNGKARAAYGRSLS